MSRRTILMIRDRHKCMDLVDFKIFYLRGTCRRIDNRLFGYGRRALRGGERDEKREARGRKKSREHKSKVDYNKQQEHDQ